MAKVNDINNITLPVYKRLKKDIKKVVETDIPNAIEVSQDIISKLVPIYNSETGETRITFPANVLPLSFYCNELGHYLFFDYAAGSVIDETNIYVGILEYIHIDNKPHVRINIENNEFTSITNGQLTYCYFNFLEDYLNTYYLYNPQNGTKLYQHTFTGGNITFISTISKPIYYRNVFGTNSFVTTASGGPGDKIKIIGFIYYIDVGTPNLYYATENNICVPHKVSDNSILNAPTLLDTFSTVTEL